MRTYLLLLFLVVFLFVGCGKRSAGDVSLIKRNGFVTVMTNAAFPPYEYLDENGMPCGIDFDIAQRVSNELGVKLNVRNVSFDYVFKGVADGYADFGISAITITEGRQKNIAFSNPYFETNQCLLLLEGNDVANFEELAGKAIGACHGTTGYAFLEKQIGEGVLADSHTLLVPFENAEDSFPMLRRRKLAAMLVDEAAAIKFARDNQGMHYLPLRMKDGKAVSEKYGVIALPQNNLLIDVINSVIEKMQKDGSLTQSFEYHEEHKVK